MFPNAFRALVLASVSLSAACVSSEAGLVDTDGDGLTDDFEAVLGTDPTVADTDGDGVPDGGELIRGTDPLNNDPDADGLSTQAEVEAGTNPNDWDTDDDGLSDGAELEHRADPNDPDTDDDGLSDGEEVLIHGSDPTLVDTDGDDYLDVWEVAEGTDPADAEDRIYTGGWPYEPDKSALGVSTGADPMAGVLSPRFRLTDQYGDRVDLYDFANQDVPVLVMLVGDWCYWCHEFGKALRGEDGAFDQFSDMFTWVDGLGPAIANGDVSLIFVVDGDSTGGTADAVAVQAWVDAHPIQGVPVLADPMKSVADWLSPGGYPAAVLLDSDMTVLSTGEYADVLDATMLEIQ